MNKRTRLREILCMPVCVCMHVLLCVPVALALAQFALEAKQALSILLLRNVQKSGKVCLLEFMCY